MKNRRCKLIGLFLSLILVLCLIYFNVSKKESHTILEIDSTYEILLESKIDSFINKNIKDNTLKRGFFYQKEDVLTFFEYKLLGIDQNQVYVWLIKADYSKNAESINKQNLVSLPFLFKYRQSTNGIIIISFNYPKDGTRYENDIVRLFPQAIVDEFPQDSEKKSMEDSLDKGVYEKLTK